MGSRTPWGGCTTRRPCRPRPRGGRGGGPRRAPSAERRRPGARPATSYALLRTRGEVAEVDLFDRGDAAAHRRAEAQEALRRSGEGAVEDDAGAPDLAVVGESAGGGHGVGARVADDLEDAHVELGSAVVSLLAGLRDPVRHEAGVVRPEGADHAAVLRVLAGLELDAPPLDVALKPEPLRHAEHVQELAFLDQLVRRDLLAELLHGEVAPFVELVARDANFEQLRCLRGRTGDEMRLGVYEQTNLVAREGRERGDRVIAAGRVGRDAARELFQRAGSPHLARHPRTVRPAFIDPGARDAKGRNFDDRHRDGQLLTRGGGSLTIIDDEGVGHSDLVPRESFDRGLGRPGGPGPNSGHRTGGADAGRKGERSSPWLMPCHESIGGPASSGDGGARYPIFVLLKIASPPRES